MDWRIPSDAVGMRASHAVNENLPSRKITQPLHFMCKIDDIFSSNRVRIKNYKKDLGVTQTHAVFSVALPAVLRTYSPPSSSLHDERFGAIERQRPKKQVFSKNTLW